MPFLVARGEHKKSVKVIKVLHVKCAPATTSTGKIFEKHSSFHVKERTTGKFNFYFQGAFC